MLAMLAETGTEANGSPPAAVTYSLKGYTINRIIPAIPPTVVISETIVRIIRAAYINITYGRTKKLDITNNVGILPKK